MRDTCATGNPAVKGRVENLQGPDGKPVAGAGPGNSRALTHGAYSTVTLAPRAGKLAEWLRSLVVAYRDEDEPAVQVAALALARLERAEADLTDNGLVDAKGELRPLVKVIGNFQAEARRTLEALSLTPATRTRLNLDRGRGAALAEHLARRYGGNK